MRPAPDALVESVLVLTTLAAPRRPGPLRRRRPRHVTEAEPEPVPTARATVVRSAAFASADEARDWLAGLRADPAARDAELAAAMAVLNRGLHAHRTASADPYVPDVSPSRALVVRVGYGSGAAVADGRYEEALELPHAGWGRPRRSMEAPEERFAMLLSGRARTLPAEELVLRARADLSAGRLEEAALQARVAIEALLAAVDSSACAAHRETVATAANEALRGPLSNAHAGAIEEAVAEMERALRKRRLGG